VLLLPHFASFFATPPLAVDLEVCNELSPPAAAATAACVPFDRVLSLIDDDYQGDNYRD
jgi:hypothetical protein